MVYLGLSLIVAGTLILIGTIIFIGIDMNRALESSNREKFLDGFTLYGIRKNYPRGLVVIIISIIVTVIGLAVFTFDVPNNFPGS